jgi:hypothetical protein
MTLSPKQPRSDKSEWYYDQSSACRRLPAKMLVPVKTYSQLPLGGGARASVLSNVPTAAGQRESGNVR